MAGERLPGLDLVEEREQESTKEDFIRRLITSIDYVANEILTYSIRSAVHVGESIFTQNRVIGPGIRRSDCSTEENRLAFRSESPVGVIDDRWLELLEDARPRWNAFVCVEQIWTKRQMLLFSVRLYWVVIDLVGPSAHAAPPYTKCVFGIARGRLQLRSGMTVNMP